MKIHPFNDFVLVEIIKRANVTPAGIYVSENEDSEVHQIQIVLAKVREVGQGRMLDGGTRNPMDVSVGDLVEFAGGAPIFPYKGSELAEIDVSLEQCVMINIGHLHARVVLGKNEKLRTRVEDVAKAEKEYKTATEVLIGV